VWPHTQLYLSEWHLRHALERLLDKLKEPEEIVRRPGQRSCSRTERSASVCGRRSTSSRERSAGGGVSTICPPGAC